MTKRQVVVKREEQDYICKICGRWVRVNLATPRIIETDKSVILSWDYGHEHKRVYTVIKKKQVQLENTVDQDYE